MAKKKASKSNKPELSKVLVRFLYDNEIAIMDKDGKASKTKKMVRKDEQLNVYPSQAIILEKRGEAIITKAISPEIEKK